MVQNWKKKKIEIDWKTEQPEQRNNIYRYNDTFY